MTRRINVVAVIAGVALAGSLGCTTKTEAPPLSGPSELATSIAIYANPDMLARSGAAQSQITIQARDARNQPIASLAVTLATWGLDALGGTVTGDVGQLSAKQLVTGGDGRASAFYNAPNAPADKLVSVRILATPVGTDATGATARSVTIGLTAPIIANPPTPSFTFEPSTPTGDQKVYFNATASLPGSSPIATYSWDFGDGTTGSGIAPVHQFNGCSTSASNFTPGNFTVELRVTDALGNQSVIPARKFVTVTKCKP